MQYETVTETIETAPASTKWVKKKADKNCLSANPDDCLVWCLVETPAQFKTVTKKIARGCADGYTADSNGGCSRTIDIPAEYETRTYERPVTVAPQASSVDAVYKTVSYRKIATPASTTSREVPAQYTTRTYSQLATPARVVSTEVPAQYETRSYQRLVSAARTEVTEVPAEYITRTYSSLVADAVAADAPAQAAQYETRTFERLVQDASTQSVPGQDPGNLTTTYSSQKLVSDARVESADVAAQYTTRTYQKLAADAGTRTVDVPAEYSTITKRNLVKAGGFTEWREVICDTDITADLVRRVQVALMAKGYDLPRYGADNDLGAETKAALVKFQRDNNLPIGQLDLETLKALGVQR
jgi:hypothetical protein